MKDFYTFYIPEWEVDKFFSPIRTKLDCIRLLANSVRIMLLSNELGSSSSMIYLVVSKTSRLFYESEEKIFSINFPFMIISDSINKSFYFKNTYEIDNKVISQLIEILSEDDMLSQESIYDFSDSIIKVDDSEDELIWKLIRELMLFEEGYIRYDFDPKNSNPNFHPLHHYDVFYSSNATLKLGLRSKVSFDEMKSFIDPKEKCIYLES